MLDSPCTILRFPCMNLALLLHLFEIKHMGFCIHYFFQLLALPPTWTQFMYSRHITFWHLSTLQLFDTHKHKVKLGFGFDLSIYCVKFVQ